MRKNKQGKLTANGVILEKHEMATVVFLLNLGHDIELIPKSNQRGVHTPDMWMEGQKWEMKSPKGEGEYLMANTIQKAVKQSHYIIIDLRRTKRYQAKCLQEIEKEIQEEREQQEQVDMQSSTSNKWNWRK